jgi:hypothetical protein
MKQLWIEKIRRIQFTVQGRDTPVLAQLVVVKWATLRRYLMTTSVWGWTARPPDVSLRLAWQEPAAVAAA